MQSLQKIVENLDPKKMPSARPLTTNPTTSSSLSSDKAAKRIELLFSKFAAFYGHVWRSQFSDDVFLKFAKKEWQEALNGYSDDVINQAILHCSEWVALPPTIPQFRQCCRDIKKQTSFQVIKEHFVPANQDVVQSCLQKIKALLNK